MCIKRVVVSTPLNIVMNEAGFHELWTLRSWNLDTESPWLMSSTVRFYGWTENSREVDMDMREMVDKVKKGEELYGKSSLTPYMQGVAARNSRYSMLMVHVIPWANFFNHNQVSVDASVDRWRLSTKNSD
jgi:hypothetical protein